MFDINGLTTDSNTTATVALDPTGRLLGLLVEPSLSGAVSAAVVDIDWTPVFRLAELNASDAKQIPLFKPPPVYCDDAAARRIEGLRQDGGPVAIQMGVTGGRPNYFEILDLDQTMAKKPIAGITTMYRGPFVDSAILIVMLVLAWRNLRASRGDRRNALRCALIIGGLYALMEILSMELGGWYNWILQGLGRGTGHVLIHAFRIWVVYMAIEPYVRRVWPRMLVGLVRLLSGRLSDPAVGRELLIGMVVGCGLVAMLALVSVGSGGFGNQGSGQLLNGFELWPLLSPGTFLSAKAHRVAWTVMSAAETAALLIAIRLLTRHTSAAFGLGVVVLSATAYFWFMNFGPGTMWPALAYAACFGVAMALLYTKVGILSAIIAMFVIRPYALYTTDFGAWFASYGMAELGILLALAGYGLWVSLAGQPIFKDMLAEPQPNG